MRLCVLLSLFVCAPALAQFTQAAQAPPAKTADTKTSLLEGRLTIVLPPQAHVETPPVPNAAEVQRDAARVVITQGTVQLAMMAEELYEKIGADPQAAVTRYAKGEQVTPFAMPSALKVFSFTPSQQPQGRNDPQAEEIIFVALVVHPDGGVIQLGFFVNQAGLANKAGWVGFAQQMVRHVAAGPRKLDLAAADRSFQALVPGVHDDKLALTTPAGWVTSSEDGPDFHLYRVRKVGELGAAPSECGIYVGKQPSLLHLHNPANAQLRPAKGKLLGKGADWFAWNDTPEAFMNEAIVQHPIDGTFRVHVFCSAPSDADMKNERVVVDSLRISH